jgi:hypothetical protein
VDGTATDAFAGSAEAASAVDDDAGDDDNPFAQRAKVLLVEFNTSNPGVWKAYRQQVEKELTDR